MKGVFQIRLKTTISYIYLKSSLVVRYPLLYDFLIAIVYYIKGIDLVVDILSDARIDQLEGRSPESCLSWLRSHEGCPKHDLFQLEYSRCARL